jgi:UDP-N-acetylmuramoylalanine--D-glutamate ligase
MDAPIRSGEMAVVVGSGESGAAAARLLAAVGARVRLVEREAAHVSAEVRALEHEGCLELLTGEHSPEQFRGAALVVVSPGVPLHILRPLLANAGNPPLMAELELALRYVHEPILAVTGTSGKTTTVSLAASMLEEGGKKVFLGGNIGTPLSRYVLGEDKADVLALELSSFQLQGTRSLGPRVAILLNLAPNHLDHHANFAEYRAAKFSIFARQTGTDLAILPPELEDEYRQAGYRARLEIFRPSERFGRMHLLGGHNTANAEAAWLACREFGVAEAAAIRAAQTFAPLRHRLENAGEVDGVRYVNDSKSTTVDALRAALMSFAGPTILLAGGKFKGGDLESLRPLLRERVKAALLFGASREIFEEAWKGATPVFWDTAMAPALERARTLAAPGDVVLLSPATSSFDAYANYKERGNHFCRLVEDMRMGAALASPEEER